MHGFQNPLPRAWIVHSWECLAPLDSHSHAQLAYQHLSLFAPVDTQAGSPFFAPLDANQVVKSPEPVPTSTTGGSFATFRIVSLPDADSKPDAFPTGDADSRPSDSIPEPAGALLFAAGFALVALRSRR